MRVALLFFGLTRSLKFTLNSIEGHVFKPLHDSGTAYDVFLHTYVSTKPFTNPRAREFGVALDPDEWNLLSPKGVDIENLEEVRDGIPLQEYRTHPDPWNTNYVSVDNFVLASRSRERVMRLVKETSDRERSTYDYFVFIRPDCRYLTDLSRNMLEAAGDSIIVVPDFHLFPMNDRFAICTPVSLEAYGGAYQDLLAYSRCRPCHAEQFLTHRLRERGISTINVRFRFNRVRADGREQGDTTP